MDSVKLTAEIERQAYLTYLNLFKNLGDAIAFERQVLSIGSNLLPQCAQGVLLGGPPTASYWQWLAGQVSDIGGVAERDHKHHTEATAVRQEAEPRERMKGGDFKFHAHGVLLGESPTASYWNVPGGIRKVIK